MEDNNILENTTQESEEKEETKTYTADEVQKMIEDGRKQALEEANKRAEKNYKARVKEAEKLAKMSESEKFQYELEQREKAIAEKEHQLAIAENKNEASKILADKGLSVSLVDFVVAEDAETMMENIKLLDDEFKKCVKAEVEKRLVTSTPKKNLPLDETLTRETFSKMSVLQQAEIYRNNPDLYNKLTGG